MWLGHSRGYLVDWLTQVWVRLTGRVVDLAKHPWLAGPMGDTAAIGEGFFEAFAASHGLTLRSTGRTGLLEDLDVLRGTAPPPLRVAPDVAAFYTGTSDYDLDAWSEWTGAFRPFGWLLARLFSRRLQQLNVPLSGLDTSRGMSSEVIALVEPATGRRVCCAWVRRLLHTGHVVYAGAYSTCVAPDAQTRCVRVVFPLPNGNAVVIMRPSVGEDGSVTLASAGRAFGSPGFYFTVGAGPGRVHARYVRSLRERIHVYPSPDGTRADHVLSLWGLTFLRLHYRLRLRASRPTAGARSEPEAQRLLGAE
jgi:hypothetical protein